LLLLQTKTLEWAEELILANFGITVVALTIRKHCEHAEWVSTGKSCLVKSKL